MNSTILLQKLIEIERSIGVESESTVRRKVLDVQDCLLQMQGETVQHLRAQTTMGTSQRFTRLWELAIRREPEGEV